MSRSSYYNDPALKVAACVDAEAGVDAGWSYTASDEELNACVQKFGLSPALVSLISFSMNVPFRPESKEFLRQALELLPVGSDSLAAVRAWMLGLWRDPNYGIKAKLENTSAFSQASAIIQLIEGSASTSVSAKEWRKARSALMAAKAELSDAAPYAELVAAMAWDVESMPRVTADIWTAWETATVSAMNREAGWEKDKQDRVVEEVRRAYMAIAAELPPPPEDEAQGEEYEKLVHVAVTARLEEVGVAEDFEAFKRYSTEHLGPAILAWRKVALQSLLEMCRNAPASSEAFTSKS